MFHSVTVRVDDGLSFFLKIPRRCRGVILTFVVVIRQFRQIILSGLVFQPVFVLVGDGLRNLFKIHTRRDNIICRQSNSTLTGRFPIPVRCWKHSRDNKTNGAAILDLNGGNVLATNVPSLDKGRTTSYHFEHRLLFDFLFGPSPQVREERPSEA